MDTSDPKAFRKRSQQAKLSARERTETIRQIMASKGGRAWIFDMLSRAHIWSSTVNQNPYFTYFSEGERNQGLMLLSEVEQAAPESYTRMIQESQDVNRLADPTNDADNDGADGGPGDPDE